MTSPGHSSSGHEMHEAGDVLGAPAPAVERGAPVRKTSTTFHEPPDYRGADLDLEGGQGATRQTRTFSRREASRIDSAHFFGGDVAAEKQELHLERFASQKGKDQIVVHWEGENDSENPLTWSFAYKCYLTVCAAVLVLNSTFTSSCPSGIVTQMEEYFGFGQIVGILTISLWVAGYCLGPLIWGPLSERIGRRPVFLISIFAYTIWNVACALAHNTPSILVFRFLGGVFGAAPLTTSGGTIADVWDAKRRGIALSLFSVAPFAGPALGPIVSGAISVTGTSWRWVYWVCAMFSGACFVIVFATMKETYAPVILKRKAQRIRKETGSSIYVAPLELTPLHAKTLLHDTLLFPFAMLLREPILAAMALYLGFVYGLIYLQFEAFPIIFQTPQPQGYGYNGLLGGVCFLSLFTGGVIGCIFYVVFFNPRYVRLVDEYAAKGQRVPPEERLYVVCIAAPCLAASFFWIGWTGKPSISAASPLCAGVLLGFAILLIFLGLFNYIVDTYLSRAASALAGNTVVRSAFGAGFPLFAGQMYNRLGTPWASSLLGFLAVVLGVVPFVLVAYGPKIRALSKHAAD